MNSRTHVSAARHTVRRLVGVLAVVTFAAATTFAHTSSADRAGAASLVLPELGAPSGQLQAVRAVAIALADRLAWPGKAAAPSRTADPTTGQAITTVEFHAADGRLAGAITLDTGGRPLEVVDLSSGPALDAPVINDAEAPRVARRLVAVAGFAPPAAAPLTTWDAGMDAWCVRWVRSVGTVPAPTDGLIAWVHRGGQLKAVSERETPLAPAPGPLIPAAAATAAAQTAAARWHLDRMPALTYVAPYLAWVAPNGFGDLSPGISPNEPLHLAWVVGLSYVPPGWRERHLVELDVDASSGAVIGGTETA